MKRPLTFLILFFLTGCISVENQVRPNGPTSSSVAQKKTLLNNVWSIQKGMTYKEVTNMLGDQVVVGYNVKPGPEESLEAIVIKNPTRKEVEGDHAIAYYFAKVQKPDGIISDDELVPLIFKDDVLVDKGWDAVFKLRNEL